MPISYQIESGCRNEVICCLCPIADRREHPTVPRGMGTHNNAVWAIPFKTQVDEVEVPLLGQF